MENKMRVLFVDDEPNVLKGLQRSLRPMRHEWDMVFVPSGREALEVLAEQPFHAIVSDMRMPEMDGAQLLNEVLKRHPEVIRIILSGYSDKEMIMRAVGATHQYLNKPCDPDTLRSSINGALQLRMLLNDEPSLMPLIARIETLPCMPALYTKVVDELRQPEPSITKIAEIVSQDPAMAAKVLQLVNSAFFGLAQQITKLDRAVCLIGLDAIKALVLSARVFTELTKGEKLCICMDTLWEHSLLVGNLAKKIAMAEKATPEAVNDSLTAGLLHDIGQLILAANLGNEYAQVRELATREEYELNRVEELEFGATHAGLGAYLLGIWGLPNSIVEAVAFHHDPEHGVTTTSGFSALTAIHVANALVHEHCENHGCGAHERLNEEYLEAHGYATSVPKWRQLADEFFAAENVAA